MPDAVIDSLHNNDDNMVIKNNRKNCSNEIDQLQHYTHIASYLSVLNHYYDIYSRCCIFKIKDKMHCGKYILEFIKQSSDKFSMLEESKFKNCLKRLVRNNKPL
jgi:hypothetical protein